LLLASVAFVSVPVLAQEGPAGAIRIEYVPPTNPAHQSLYALLQDRKALEKIQAAFNPFRLPIGVTVRTIGCDGVSNAYYQPLNGVPTITLCYEYLQEIRDKLPTDTTEGGITAVDALAGQFFYAVAHEFGHLAFDVYEIPVFGREEDAADNFATYIMLQFREDGRRLVSGAAYSYHHILVEDRQQDSKATLRLAAFSSNHSQPEERYFNLLCMAYGSDAKRYGDLVEKGWLPQSRAKDCKYEFDVMNFAFHRAVTPHIDQERARQVLDTNWLTATVPPPPRR
jgi:hypothetical protein